jgi:hypothetical protein
MRDRFPTQINLAGPGFVDQDLSPRGMSHSAQYCQGKWAIVLVSQESSYPPNQTACSLEVGL